MKFVLLFAIVAAVHTAESRPNAISPHGRIVGGSATSIDQVPYQASLRVFNSHICGASIISENWIVTAAHCATYPSSWYTVRVGSTRTNTGGSVLDVSSVISHSKYASNSFGVPVSDIALVKTSTIAMDDTRQPVPLYGDHEDVVVGSLSIITGWGTTSQGGSSATVLRTVSVPIVSKTDCNEAYSSWGGLPSGQICAAYPEGGKDACQGDSGGPLTIDGRLAGIVSWGNGCARAGYPGVYTEVAAHREWITENSGV